MKIQKKEASKVFQPITLEIVIESEDELNALQTISGLDWSIPEWVRQKLNTGDINTMSRVLTTIYKALK